MESQYNYGASLTPRQDIICGVELRPFCLGHLILLEGTHNPLLSKEAIDINYQEGVYRFFQALLICALSYEDGCTLLNDSKLFVNEWNTFQKNMIKNMKVEKGWNIHAKLKMFNDYMTYYLDMPSYKLLTKNDKSVGSGTDWKTAIAVIFKKLDYSKSEILNMSLKQLFQEWTANAEAEGSIQVFNKFTADKIKAALKKEKEKANGLRS